MKKEKKRKSFVKIKQQPLNYNIKNNLQLVCQRIKIIIINHVANNIKNET